MARRADGSGAPPLNVFPDEFVKCLLLGLGAGLARHDYFLDSVAEHLQLDPVPDVAAREVGFAEEATILRPVVERLLLEPGELAGHAPRPHADSHFRRLPPDPGTVEQLVDRRVLKPPVPALTRLGSWQLPSFSRRLDQGVVELLRSGHPAVLSTAVGHPSDDGDDVRRQSLRRWGDENHKRTTGLEPATSSLGSSRSTS